MRMKVMFLCALLIACIFTAVASGKAVATTVYDTVVQQGEARLTCSDSNYTELVDIRSTYLSIIEDSQASGHSTFWSYYQDVVNEGQGWALTQNIASMDEVSDPVPYSLTLVVSSSPPGSASFGTNWGLNVLLAQSAYGATIFCDSADGMYVVFNTFTSSRLLAAHNTNTGGRVKPVYSKIPVTYPTGYEGEAVAGAMPPAKYVAMGDSYSSGEGNGTFELGTDDSGVNECHRSPYAYPEWLSQTQSLDMDDFLSVACSGATTENVLGGQWNESAQIDALSDTTEIVTITIGGNDIGFVDFATECVVDDCDTSTTIYSDTLYSINNDLPSDLNDVFEEIADNTDTAEVYVIGYPYVTPGSDLNNLPVQCNYLNSTLGTGQDSVAARAVIDELNGVIEDELDAFVNTFSSSTFTFIDPNLSVDGSFDGHDVCANPNAYFHNITPNDVVGLGYREKIFHPNIDGHYEYYNIVMGEIEAS